jgi:DNA polymerase-4
MRAEQIAGRAVVLKLKTADFRLLTRRRTLAVPTQTAHTLFKVGRELLAGEARGTAYRLIGIGCAELIEAGDAPDDLFAAEETRARKGERAMDAIRAKYGVDAVVSGRVLK